MANFSELIYKSADPTVGIASGEANWVLGIKPNGSAVVVDIAGDSKVFRHADLRPVAETPGADDLVAYSKKGADDMFFKKENVETNPTPQMLSDDKVFSCYAVSQLITQTSDGSKWEAVSGSSPAAIRPKSGKGVVIGGAEGATAPLTVNGNATISGNASVGGTAALKGNTTIGTSGGASATLTVTGNTTIGASGGSSASLTVNGSSTTSSLVVNGTSALAGATTVGTSGTPAALTVNGTCTATEFYEPSDRALKENITSVSDIKMGKVASIPFVEFDWKDGRGHSYGVIAQDVADKFPELVQKTADGMLRVNYIAFLCAKVAMLEGELFKLKQQINGGN